MSTVIYLAHHYFAPTRDEMNANRINAAKWGIWIAKTFDVAVSADWIWWTEVLEETSENRELGLRCDDRSIAVCHEFWMVGGKVSSGVARGRSVAHAHDLEIRDLTFMGYKPPTTNWWPDIVKIRNDLRRKELLRL